MLFNYDSDNIKSIFDYAKKLENKSFNDILKEYNNSFHKSYESANSKKFIQNDNYTVSNDNDVYHINSNAKGLLGSFLEKYYFGYNPNSKQEADFPEVGVELKQTCIDIKKDGSFSAGERLSITNISYDKPVIDL